MFVPKPVSIAVRVLEPVMVAVEAPGVVFVSVATTHSVGP
jgi:hypothetical protein